MLGFPKRTQAVTEKSLEQAMDRAIKRFQAGDSVGAEREVHVLVEQAAAHGTDTPLYAKALFNESTVLCGVGDLRRAASCCRAAADVPAMDEQGQKDRLTYLMNLGDILTRLEELDEAEEVLRSSLAERKEFYGTGHPGYAYGLGSLADLLLSCGKADEGLPLIDEALGIYGPTLHEQFPHDVALRAFLCKAAASADADPFPGWAKMPAEVREEIVRRVIERAERSEPQLSFEVLRDLRLRLLSDSGRRPNELVNVCAAMSDAARQAGNDEGRVEAARAALEAVRESGDPLGIVKVLQGLAFALSDAGRTDETEQAYAEAVQLAEGVRDRSVIANVLRNQAIWVAEQGDKVRARGLHEKAVAAAADSGDRRMQGRTCCAFGIFLQHEGDLEHARPLLVRSLKLLSPDDPDAFYAQDHLQALDRNEKCACGDQTDETLSALIERMVMERAPKGVLKGLKVSLGEDGVSVTVDAARAPTDAEAEELNRIISVTISEMQQKYRRAGYG